MIKQGSRVKGVTKHFNKKKGTIVAISGEGNKRKFEVLWDDQSQAVLNRRGLTKIDDATVENQHITVPMDEIPDEEIHGDDSKDNAGDNGDRFIELDEDDELENEIGPEDYLQDNIVT